MTEPSAARPDQAILDFLRTSGLVQDIAAARLTPLTGGVSSDIWLVEAERSFCVKRALPQLRVEAEWFVAVERSLYEAAWLKGVAEFLPQAVPQLLADDPHAGIFAMAYLDPARHTLWKADLLAGRVDPDAAAEVGRRLGQIHAAFARDPLAPQRFATDGIFRAIRIEPYLLATAEAHPDLASVLQGLAERTMQTARTVVHGDVSPKNIMIGPDGPVFLDAECAWYGDPAFDLAFCLNHLLLKTIAVPSANGPLLAAFGRLAESYLRHVDWEPPAEVEARAASLLPGLLLARIDGKSPVEYIRADGDKDRVRRIARGLLSDLPGTLPAVVSAWAGPISDRKS
jgi:aminoglycoside phosphotransferase (APT) family kinase protein